VQATGYETIAEQTGMGCANTTGKWEDTQGANWLHPGGPKTSIQIIANHPVAQVNWTDALAYAAWAGKRLPTEQEWEKAARDMNGREYPWGNQEPTRGLCNFNKHEGRKTSVGKYSLQGDSLYGCMDMSGNVWEWTASEKEGGEVLCGGGWSHPAEYVRLILRSIHYQMNAVTQIGFGV
jgi:formylglycine-generating enzyme required for sulfatase activity